MARALRFQADLPKQFWGYCLLTATHSINKIPTSATEFKIPYKSLFQAKEDYSHLKTFGCLCFASIHDSDKFDPRAIKSVFLGYLDNQKGYLLYNLQTKKVFVSRHVIFHEHVFPFSSQNTSTLPSYHSLPWPVDDPAPIFHSPSQPSPPSSPDAPISSHATYPAMVSSHSMVSSQTSSSSIPIQPRQSNRVRTPSVKLKDFVISSMYHPISSPYSQYDATAFIVYDQFDSTDLYFINALDNHVDPTFYTQAIKQQHWTDDIHKGLSALEANNT